MSTTITQTTRHELYTEYTVLVERVYCSHPLAQTFHVCVVHDSPGFPMCFTTWSRCIENRGIFAIDGDCRRAARAKAIRDYRNHVKANS